MIKKLKQTETLSEDLIDKINEIVDYINSKDNGVEADEVSGEEDNLLK